ncbi:MAG: MFS transporter [Treponema sp.]|nr:MFS transporter [Treponema sp.]
MRNIFFLGLISFFTDLSTEMVYPLIPLYLMTVFGASYVLIGIIEGIAESLANLLKVYSGYLTDRFQKKKLIAFSGYFAGFIYKFALIFATSWVGILFAKILDRFGKGIRTSPRDVLVSESADKENLGKAFGFHKAIDMLGASLGILIVFLILFNSTGEINFRNFFVLSTIPAALGLLMFVFVKETKRLAPLDDQLNKPQAQAAQNAKKERPAPFWKSISQINGQLKLYLLVVFIFTLGNSSKVFLILKARNAGYNEVNVILLFLIYHFVAAMLAMPMGRLSDKIGRKNLLVPGYITFALCYLGFAFAETIPVFIFLFVLYGIYTAMITGVERAFVSEISPKELKGTMLGLHSTVAGIALLPASILAGVLWTNFGASVPFIFGAGLSLLAAGLLVVFMKGKLTVN